MKKTTSKFSLALFAAFICLSLALIFSAQTPHKAANTVTQFSTIDALLAGVYDGQTTLKELKEYGDSGIGTFNSLDGEMLMLGGKVYQIKADGKIYRPDDATRTPFASVVFFAPQKSAKLDEKTTMKSLFAKLEKTHINKNLPYAIRLKGKFSYMKTRSVPAQKRPYPELAVVTKTQPVFEMESTEGTVFGFWLPAFTKGINVDGFHLHYADAALLRGGHILDFTVENCTVEIAQMDGINLALPKNSEDFNSANLQKDRSVELKAVEQGE